MDELEILRSEVKTYKDHILNLMAEKVSLDQQLVETLKSSLTIRKDLYLSNEKVNKFSKEIIELKEKESQLQYKLDSLEKGNVLDCILESAN